MMKYIILIVIVLLTACNPCKYVSKHPECFPADSVIVTNTVIQKDSIYFTEPDSMAISLLFECDSNNNVLMREINDLSSKGIETKIIFKDNRLDVSGFVDSIAVLNKLIETTKSKEISKINPVNVQLKKDNEKLNKKLDRKKLIIKILAGLSLILFFIIVFLLKFK